MQSQNCAKSPSALCAASDFPNGCEGRQAFQKQRRTLRIIVISILTYPLYSIVKEQSNDPAISRPDDRLLAISVRRSTRGL
jgi:hypothetical protein